MAGAVRELITKVKIMLDQSSVTRTNNAITRIKRDLNQLSNKRLKVKVNVDSSSLNSALANVRNQMAHLNLQVHANASLMTIRAATVNLYGRINNRGGSGGNGGGNGGGGRTGGGGGGLADNGGTLAAAGAAMVAPLAFPVKSAMDFEAALSSVQAKLGLTKDEMQGVAKEAEKLSAETKFNSVEVLQAADYLAQAGWKEKEIRAGLGDMLKLAIAGDMDLARTADIVSDGLTALNLTAQDTAHFNDIMATAASNSNTNISIMGETFKQLLPVAGTLGYTIDDVGLAIELMADKGLKGERAGSSLVAVLNGMSKPTKDAAEVMKKLNIEMFNADGSAKPLKNVIEQLRKSFSGLTQEQKTNYANTIAGVDGMKGLLDIVGATDERYKQFEGTIQNAKGATDRMAKIMHDNAKGAVEDLMSALQGLAKTIGDVFLKSLGNATKGVTDFVRKIGDFAKAHPQIVAGITAFVAGAGALLVVLGSIGLGISAISTAMGALSGVFAAVGSVLSVGLAPLLAIFGAIAAVIYTVKENWDTVVAFFQPGIDSMMEGIAQLQSAWQNLQPFIAAITPLLQFIAQLIGGVIVGAVGVMFRVFMGAFNAISGIINVVASGLGEVGNLINWIAGGLAGLIEKAQAFLGMRGAIAQTNASITDRWFNNGGGGGTTNTQNNTYNLTNPNQYGAAASSANQFFAYS